MYSEQEIERKRDRDRDREREREKERERERERERGGCHGKNKGWKIRVLENKQKTVR